jgi:NAD-dependent SIR2 family protein deacetylase
MKEKHYFYEFTCETCGKKYKFPSEQAPPCRVCNSPLTLKRREVPDKWFKKRKVWYNNFIKKIKL